MINEKEYNLQDIINSQTNLSGIDLMEKIEKKCEYLDQIKEQLTYYIPELYNNDNNYKKIIDDLKNYYVQSCKALESLSGL